MTLNFASDNVGPLAPAIMDAVVTANAGSAMPYGAEPEMSDVQDQIRALFAWAEAEVVLVTNGTTANAIALATLCPPWGAVLCHETAHIHVDECGAPEFYSGAKLITVGGEDGKMTPDTLRTALARLHQGVVHSVQPRALSLTNVTEVGTVYTLAEIRALQDVARDAGLRVHLDGARFANACATLGCSAAQMAQGFDVVSFGATKNGCMGLEAIVFPNADLRWEAELRRKRGGHLWSKHRFLSAQMAAYLTDDLWLDLARAANMTAKALAEGLRALPGAAFAWDPQANMIFARLPRAAHKRAFKGGAEYYLMDGDLDGPDEALVLCRLVCDWSKTQDDVEQLLALYAAR